MSYSSFEWLPLCAGLTILGLILTYFAYRRRGRRAAMMGAAWSLLPIAAYLTGATEMLWKIGTAIGQFATGFVFSPEKWAGIGVTGLAVALFLAAGGRQRRKAAREQRKAARAGQEREQAEGGRVAGMGAQTVPRRSPPGDQGGLRSRPCWRSSSPAPSPPTMGTSPPGSISRSGGQPGSPPSRCCSRCGSPAPASRPQAPADTPPPARVTSGQSAS